MRFKIMKQGGYGTAGIAPTGGNMSGPVVLAGNPTQPLEASTKGYVDSALGSLNGASLTSGLIPAERLPAFTGDLTNRAGSNSFTLTETGVTPSTYPKVTVNTKGRITNGYLLTEDDLPNLDYSKVTTGKPTTLAGYGITDAIAPTGGTMTGTLTVANDPTGPLHVATKGYIDTLNAGSATGSLKVGDVVRKVSPITPPGFLRCNGGDVSRSTYSALFDVLKESFPAKITLDYTSYAAFGGGKPWERQYEFKTTTAGSPAWATQGSLNVPTYNGEVIVTKNRVYVIGGKQSSVGMYAVQTAVINSDGTLGAFSRDTNLPSEMTDHTAFVTKNRVYICGGLDSANNSNQTVYTAPINADGTLGVWTRNTSLPVAIARAFSVLTKNRVYVFSSSGNTQCTAPINADGTLGTWTTLTLTQIGLPNGTRYAFFTTRNRVYAFAGGNSFFTAVINSDGTLGTFAVASITVNNFELVEVRFFVTRTRVWLLGGFRTDLNVVMQISLTAPINADGTIGNFVTSSNLAAPVMSTQIAAIKNRLYILGGMTGDNDGAQNATATIQYATVSGDQALTDYSMLYNGTINKFDGSNISGEIVVQNDYPDLPTTQPGAGRPWQNQYYINTTQTADFTAAWTGTSNFPNTLSDGAAFITKNRVYYVGGAISYNTLSNVVYSAPIDANGVIGSWSNVGTIPAATGYINSNTVVTRNRVYIIGGTQSTSGGGTLNSMLTAVINSDGTIGAFSTISNLPFSGYAMSVFTTNNRVYVTGGTFNTNTWTAPINADGTIGTWTNGPPTPVAFVHAQCVVTRNRVYMIGGYSNGTIVSTAPISVDGIVGSWSSATSLPAAMSYVHSYSTAGRVWLFGSNDSGSPCYTAAINADGTIGTWFTSAITSPPLTIGTVVCTSSRVYVLGGVTGTGGSTKVQAMYYTTITGGLNDYSAYYDGTITPIATSNFKLPDYSAKELPGSYTYIKV